MDAAFVTTIARCSLPLSTRSIPFDGRLRCLPYQITPLHTTMMETSRRTPLIALLCVKLSAVNATPGSRAKRECHAPRQSCFQFKYRFLHFTISTFTGTGALSVTQYSGSTTATSATSGCPPRISPIIVQTVDFAALAVRTTFSTVMTVVCALISLCSTNTIVNLASTRPTAPSARSSYSAVVPLPMKCLVGMPFTGIVSVSWRHMIHAVQFAKRRPRHLNE